MNNNISKIRQFLKSKKRAFLFRLFINRLAFLVGIILLLLSATSALFSFTSLLLFINVFYLIIIIALPSLFLWPFLIPLLKNRGLKIIAQKLESQKKDQFNYLHSAYELSEDKTYQENDLTPLVYQKAIDTFANFKNCLKPKIKLTNIIVLLVSLSSFYLSLFHLNPTIKNWLSYPFNKTSINLYGSSSSQKIAKYGSVTLHCKTEKAFDNPIELKIRNISTGSQVDKRSIIPDSKGNYNCKIDSIKESFEFTFNSGPLHSSARIVTVVPPPKLYSLKVKVRSPYYTAKGTIDLNEGNGDITACYGSKASFAIEGTEPLKNCSLIKNQKDTINLSIENGKAKGELRLYSKGSYTFVLKDSLNQTSDSTPSYFIDIIPDLAPTVSIVKPGRDKILSEAQKETLNVELYDDYGINTLKLGYRKTSINDPETYFKKISIKEKNSNAISLSIPWNITELTLYPGDSLYYWAEVADNKPFGSPNSAVSDTFIFRLPTYSEIHKMIAEREKGAGKALESVKEMQENIEKRLEDLQSSTGKKSELSWEDKQIMKDLQEKMKEQSDSLSSAIEAMKEAVEKLKESGSSEKITDKMQEVQKELEKLLEEMGDSLLFKKDPLKAPPSISDLKKSLEKMAKNLPDLEKRLDNTIKYLKMLQKESERAMLADRAQKLAEEQFKISETLKDEELSQREKDLQKRVDDLLNDTKKSLDDKDSPVKSNDLSSLSDVQKSSENVKNEMSNQQTPSKSSMNQMSASLSAMSSELQSTLSSAMAEAAKKDYNNLVKMAQNSISMTEWQKSISDQMNKSQNSSEKRAAAQQSLKDALTNSTFELNELSMVPPMILADLYSSMQKSGKAMKKALNTIHSPQSSFHMNNATSALNELTEKLLSAADGMSQQSGGSGGGSGGLQQALQQLSGQQAAINAATQQLLKSMLQGNKPGQQGQGQQQQGGQNSGENSGLTGEAKQSVQKAQQALADKLKELSEKYGDSKDGNLKSRVEELEKEARRITRLFNNPQQEISEKQDLLLKRMLDATISLNRKDEGKEERKSKSSEKIYSKFSSEEIDYSKMKADNFYKMRSKALSGDYPISYKQKISKYFDRLQKHLMSEDK